MHSSSSEARVTVIMATHNAMPYLPLAVDSILNQRMTNWRLVIVDDASSDNSVAYLRSLTDTRIIVRRLSSNSGQGVARNRALEDCETPFVAVMDADDVSHPNRLAAQIEFLNAHPSVGAVGTQFTYLGTRGRIGFGAPLPCEHADIFDNLLNGKHAIVNGSACYRTPLIKACGGYATSRAGEDWDIYLKLSERCRLANLEERYYFYRVHRASTNATRLAEVQLQCAFASHNARRRLAGLPETSLETYEAELRGRPWPERVSSRMRLVARGLYRRGVSDVLTGHAFTGYGRLVAAALMSPALTTSRLGRVAQSVRRSTTKHAQARSVAS